jgi:long-chain acyl-CoA synthetase
MYDTTVNNLVLDSLRQHDRPDLLWHKQGGRWQKISSRSFLHRVASLAGALTKLGIRKGDRVALFSENRPEWHVADLAILGLGAINVPVYPAEVVERLQYTLDHSQARLCFVSGLEQFEKVRAVWSELPQLETMIPIARVGTDAVEPGRRVLVWEAAAREDISESELAAFERTARSHGPDDIASLIYTSGTTGTPKGALLTQRNFASNVLSTLGQFGYGPAHLAMSLLPVCHIYERKVDYGYFAEGSAIAYAESFDKVVENMREVRPTIMAVVPRFFEKFHGRLLQRVGAAPGPEQKLFHWALAVGRQALPYRLARRPLPGWLSLRYRLADWFVYRPIRVELGGRMQYFISGAAPLARELNEFFHCLGLTIYEGYGLTETSPVIAVNLPGKTKLGTVGPPIPGVEVKIAPDGEILTRGPHVMKGYYKMEAETAEVLRDGWFYTGDVGFLDEDGFLTVTDRKKDLIKTAGGKYVAPQPIENQLRQSPYIENAVVVGDRRKYAVALLVPNVANLERLAAERGIVCNSPAELLANPLVRSAVQAVVDRVNERLAQYERLKRFAWLEQDFTFDEGHLTYTQKVRRRQVEEQYRNLIDRLYEEEGQPSP